jgi:hypothetical protein
VEYIFGGRVDARAGADQEWKRIDVGAELNPGAEIRTLKGAQAEVRLRGGHVVRMEEESILRLPEAPDYSAANPTYIELMQGALRVIWAKAKELATGESRYEQFRTPTAVSGVRGTDFVMKHDPDTNTDLFMVREGTVEVQGNVEGSATLNAGQQVEVQSGQVGEVQALDQAMWAQLAPERESGGGGSGWVWMLLVVLAVVAAVTVVGSALWFRAHRRRSSASAGGSARGGQRFCIRCGRPLTKGARFCTHCGGNQG